MANTRGMAAAKPAGESNVARAGPSKPPPRKRAKISKDVAAVPKRRGKLSLTRLLDLPPEVFSEVATHLLPADLLSLARSNKFFRKMFMSRTSQSFWKAAIHNMPNMPERPPQLCEPAYVSLIYSKTCSSCGARALRPMDPYLLVRFCNKCRDNKTFMVVVFDPLYSLLPRSHSTGMAYRCYVLKTDFEEIYTIREIDDQESDWFKARKAKIDERQAFGAELDLFLERMEDKREAEMDELKMQRWDQIKARLVEKGWTEQDMDGSPANFSEWQKLVLQPKPLTDRIWTNFYPKLLPILQSNREYNEQIEREQRKRKRIWIIQDLVSEIRNALPPLVHVTQKPPSASSASRTSTSSVPAVMTAKYSDVKLPYPFPSMTELLTWPMVKEIVDDDTSAEAAEIKFEAIRDEVDQKIDEWREAIERDLIEIWNVGRDEVKTDVKPGKGKGKAATLGTKRKGKSRAVAVKREPSAELKPQAAELALPKFTVTFSMLDGTTTTDISDLSPNLQLLLRADTIFKSGTLDYTYPSIVPRPVPLGPLAGVSDGMMDARWHASKIERDDECSAIAKLVLPRIGRMDVTSAEMKALGENFKCGRCKSILPETWDSLVHHFCKEEKHWKHAHKMIAADSKLNVVYYHTHTLDPKDTGPIAHFMTPQESVAHMLHNTMDDLPMMQCMQCKDLGIDASYLYSFEDNECQLVEHLDDVHDITTGVLGMHFRPCEWDMDFYDPWEFDDEGYGDSDSDMEDHFWDLMF